MHIRYLIAVMALLIIVLPSKAAGHETDQYNLPFGREFADLRVYFTREIYARLISAVEKTNARIESSLCNGEETSETERLQSPEVIARAFWAEMPFVFTHIEFWEMTLRGHEVREQFPGLVPIYRPFFWIYHHPILLLDVTKLIRLARTSTIMINGTYFGTDKLAHFFDMGYIYFSGYQEAIEEGMDEAEATSRAVRLGIGTHPIYSENMLFGKLSTGVRSNADLAANYVGMKFYQNLTREVLVQGRLQPPMLVRHEFYWRLNDHVLPHSDFFAVFITDHFNEALNPNTYVWGMAPFVRQGIKSVCEDLMVWYADDQGNPRNKDYFLNIAEDLKTYFGEEYGHEGDPHKMVSIATSCFPDNDSPEFVQTGLSAAGQFSKNATGETPVADQLKPASSNIIKKSVDDEKNLLGRSALWQAIRYGQADEVDRLIAQGADIKAADVDRETPLHQAARWGRVSIAETLLTHGADSNARALYGITPLHLAARQLRKSLIILLLKYGANANAQDIFGCTPLHDVASRGDEKLAALLAAAGADPGAKDLEGTTPLHRAAREGHAAVVKLLLSLGADATVRNAFGNTPIDEAQKGQHEEVVKYLTAEQIDIIKAKSK